MASPVPHLSQSLEHALRHAGEYAKERSHEFVTLEHLLLALIDDKDAAAVMRACGVDMEELRERITDYLDSELDNLVTDSDGPATSTVSFKRVVQRAMINVQSSGREEVTGANVLVAIFSERESHAAFFLNEQEMGRFDAVQYISHGIAKRPGLSEPRSVRGIDGEETSNPNNGNGDSNDGKKPAGGEALASFCVDLNAKARLGKIDPLIGREMEVQRTIQVLCRRSKNNPLYGGDAGVGKTAIAEGLARKIGRASCRERV